MIIVCIIYIPPVQRVKEAVEALSNSRVCEALIIAHINLLIGLKKTESFREKHKQICKGK